MSLSACLRIASFIIIMIGWVRPNANRKVALRIQVPKTLSALPYSDPFAALSVESCPTARLRPSCPGKRVVFAESHASGKHPQVFLFSPSAGERPRTRTGLVLAPIKVRGRTGSLVKSNSVKEMRLRRPETPSFPESKEDCLSRKIKKECQSLYPSQSTSAEVSFGS
jgi:hypothetical protein